MVLMMDIENVTSVLNRTFHYPLQAKIWGASISIFVAIFGTFGNVIAIMAIVKFPKLRTKPNLMVLHLSLTDLILSVICMPIMAANDLIDDGIFKDSESTYCQYYMPFQFSMQGTNMCSLVIMTINRYMKIVWTNHYPRMFTNYTVITLIVTAWLFPLICLLPATIKIWGKFGFVERKNICTILSGDGYTTFLFLVSFVIPFISLIVCYTHIFITVHRQQNVIKSHRKHSTTPRRVSRISQCIPNNLCTMELQLTKMMLVIFLEYTILNLPITLITILDKNVTYPVLNRIAAGLSWMNASFNFVVYAIMNSQFRQAYGELFGISSATTNSIPGSRTDNTNRRQS
ncbi:unnamed protein product [Owenia fusiformis]|uniref:G-protein coupled receptors family 1 profile domain-containing protein n=1 Tax=Owenia fusiformis TaxID=6347 RepID=A0A8S4PUL5_OWEFU|nr:unnamed protein product [Owenia fusiformis]